jgi:hypothetical protein
MATENIIPNDPKREEEIIEGFEILKKLDKAYEEGKISGEEYDKKTLETVEKYKLIEEPDFEMDEDEEIFDKVWDNLDNLEDNLDEIIDEMYGYLRDQPEK